MTLLCTSGVIRFSLLRVWQLNSEPILTVTGSRDITLMVRAAIMKLSVIFSCIILDCTLQKTHLGNTLMNDYMTGAFLILNWGRMRLVGLER